MAYGTNFIMGTTGGTVAAGYDLAASGKKDGGTIVGAGAIAAGDPITNDLGINTLADNLGDRAVGSKVVANDGTGAATTDRAGVDKAVSGGTLAFTPDPTGARSETFVIRTVTTKLSDVANTVLQVNGSVGDGRYDNIHGTIADRLIGSKADEAFDIMARPSTQIVPGRTKGSNAGNATTMVNPADGTAAVASEIFPSLSVPGELTYHFGAQGKPTTDEYKAKDSYEDETDTSS